MVLLARSGAGPAWRPRAGGKGVERQPICLKLGKFAASRADHELGHEAGRVGLQRQGARGHGEFIIMSKMVKSHVRLW